jgi:hypothetical protein
VLPGERDQLDQRTMDQPGVGGVGDRFRLHCVSTATRSRSYSRWRRCCGPPTGSPDQGDQLARCRWRQRVIELRSKGNPWQKLSSPQKYW